MITDDEILQAVAQGKENAEGIHRRLGKDRIKYGVLLGRLHLLAEEGKIQHQRVEITRQINISVFSV